MEQLPCSTDKGKEKKALKLITKWMRESGLKVNQSKTEVCLFYKPDCVPVVIKRGESNIVRKKSMNSKLQWIDYIAKVIAKSNQSLNALKLLRKLFCADELIKLITSNYIQSSHITLKSG